MEFHHCWPALEKMLLAISKKFTISLPRKGPSDAHETASEFIIDLHKDAPTQLL